jgi:hypothetical protein
MDRGGLEGKVAEAGRSISRRKEEGAGERVQACRMHRQAGRQQKRALAAPCDWSPCR